MYASNEDEFPRDDSDWVFLRQAIPTNTILHGAVNLSDHQQSNSSSSSSSSSDSSSSKSDRSDTSSSLASVEHEHVQNNDPIDEQDNHLSVEDPVLASHISDDEHGLLLTGENKEEVFSSEMMIRQNNDNETTPVINEYDLPNGEGGLSEELVTPTENLRRRTGANIQQTGDEHPLTVGHERGPPRMHYYRPRRNNALIVYGILVLFFAVPLVFCRLISSQRFAVKKITEDLQKTNQRLNEIKVVSIEDIQQKLTKQFEEKFQEMLNQKLIVHDQEKYSLVLQINELYHIIHLTQQNLTNTIHQLSDENERLQNQIIALEHRLQITEEQGSKDKEACPEGDDCIKSSTSPLEVLLGNLINKTTSIAGDTSINLSGLFEQLSASLSDFVDHRQKYVEESKRKLSDFANSQTAEHVQKTLRRGVENLSSSLHKAQSTYTTWARARAQQREQARTDNIEQDQKEKSVRRPWRWTFQRSHDREQMRHEIPITKKHSFNKENVCHSKCDFPVNQLCSMKNWVDRFFRP